MHTKKVILVSIILRRGSFSRFLKILKDSRNMKKKDKIFILSKLPLPLGANNLIFWHFLTCCYCKKKIIKNIDWRTIDIAINRNWNINRTWSVSVISNIKMAIWNYHQYYKMKWWASYYQQVLKEPISIKRKLINKRTEIFLSQIKEDMDTINIL